MRHLNDSTISQLGITISDVKDAYIYSCKKDIEAIKPGNVNLISPDNDTTADDYIRSCILSSEKLFILDLSLGERVLESIIITRDTINTNTNLGIVLLCALISHSIIYYPSEKFWNAIKLSIDNSSPSDTESICKAINIAKPSGLSRNINQKYDTDKSPSIGLKELMCYASAYDRISYEYCNYLGGIRTQILPMLDRRLKASNYIDISLSLAFLEILANVEDSHICRKFGHKIAKKTSNHANDLLKILEKDSSRDNTVKELNHLDYEYKEKGINPGTTADLLLSSVMIDRLLRSD